MIKSNNEFVPEIGQKCLFKAMSRMPGFGNYTDTFTECVPLMITPHGVVLNASGTQCFMDFVDYDVEFTKIKTEAEKRRDELAKQLREDIERVRTPDLAVSLVEMGWIKPKPLTEEQKDKLLVQWNHSKGMSFSDLFDLIQYELGVI